VSERPSGPAEDAAVDASALPPSTADAPTVFLSPRLRCRHWVAADRAAIVAIYGDAEAMRYVGDGTPMPEADADRWLDVTARNYARRGYGMFALEDRATGQVVGFAGLVHPGDQPEAEVKYAFARAWWGRGLATEAVRHLLEAAVARYGLTDVIATVAPAHVTSQRVLAKAGLTRRADRVEDDGTRTLVFGTALPPAFEVHLVTEANRALLDRVDEDVFDHEVRPEYASAFLANPANLLAVAVADGAVVGMASGIAYAHPDKPLQLFVIEVGVAGRFQRRGAGAALVDALLRRGRELGCREAWVATEVGNAPARGLYRALGGVEDEEPAVVYVFPLAEGAATDP
jgi:RimJ/RimL family protein N-acetyltransferase